MNDRFDPGRFTSKQKVAMYLTTLVALALLYLVPHAFTFIASLPETAWKAMMIPAVVLVCGMLLVCAYAVWLIFGTGRMTIGHTLPGVRKLTEPAQERHSCCNAEKKE